jgi:hypothetical protein
MNSALQRLAAQRVGQANRRHGAWKTAEYCTWSNMKYRCLNPRSSQYERYGERGIAICERWVESFEAFLADMGLRPGPEFSLDRIDNDGPYSPENCRWANPSQQMRNQRRTVVVTFQGERMSAVDLAQTHGMQPSTVIQRLKRGWTVEQAIRPTERMCAVGVTAHDGSGA